MAVEHWVFLGDSITEGVGSLRVNYVEQLVALLRVNSQGTAYHLLWARGVNPVSFNQFLHVNFAGKTDFDSRAASTSVCIWNLACEGTTVASDRSLLPLIRLISPKRIFVLRGSFESILRPTPAITGEWPGWVPKRWRGLATLDPRCYFSGTSLRSLTQRVEDRLRGNVRRRLQRRLGSARLLEVKNFEAELRSSLGSLIDIVDHLYLMTLPPVSEKTFPGSQTEFCKTSAVTRCIALEFCGSKVTVISFDDCGLEFEHDFYRDGFHPSIHGAAKIAEAIASRLSLSGANVA